MSYLCPLERGQIGLPITPLSLTLRTVRDREVLVRVFKYLCVKSESEEWQCFCSFWLAGPLYILALLISCICFPSLTGLIIEVTQRCGRFPLLWWHRTVLLKSRISSGRLIKWGGLFPCPHLPSQSSLSVLITTTICCSQTLSHAGIMLYEILPHNESNIFPNKCDLVIQYGFICLHSFSLKFSPTWFCQFLFYVVHLLRLVGSRMTILFQSRLKQKELGVKDELSNAFVGFVWKQLLSLSLASRWNISTTQYK